MEISVMKVADPDDLSFLLQIRHEVFVVGQNVPKEEENDEFEYTSTHFLATYDGTMCGTARWRETQEGVKLERFAVLEEFRGKGVAKALLDGMLADIKKNKKTREKKIYLHAQVHVIPFYEKSGFVIEGEEFVEAGIRHKKMYLP